MRRYSASANQSFDGPPHYSAMRISRRAEFPALSSVSASPCEIRNRAYALSTSSDLNMGVMHDIATGSRR
jgi:hypothetical protein